MAHLYHPGLCGWLEPPDADNYEAAQVIFFWFYSTAVVLVWVRGVIVMRHFEELAGLVQLLVAVRHMATVVIQFVFLMVLLTFAFFLAFLVLLGDNREVQGFSTNWQSFLTVYQRCVLCARCACVVSHYVDCCDLWCTASSSAASSPSTSRCCPIRAAMWPKSWRGST